MAEKAAYSQAAGTGRYDRSTGLLGKYDNVRRFWEDQVTGIFLRPALNQVVERKKQRLERLGILDLGCGSSWRILCASWRWNYNPEKEWGTVL